MKKENGIVFIKLILLAIIFTILGMIICICFINNTHVENKLNVIKGNKKLIESNEIIRLYYGGILENKLGIQSIKEIEITKENKQKYNTKYYNYNHNTDINSYQTLITFGKLEVRTIFL